MVGLNLSDLSSELSALTGYPALKPVTLPAFLGLLLADYFQNSPGFTIMDGNPFEPPM